MDNIVCYGDMLPQDAAWAIREDQKTHDEVREARWWHEAEAEFHEYEPCQE